VVPEEASMRKIFLTSLFGAGLAVAPAGTGFGQQKQSKCEQGERSERNWELIEHDYVYFDYILCPAGMNPPNPLVRVWITTRGDGIAVEEWAQSRGGADLVSMYHGKKKAYTLYRDLNAIPLGAFSNEARAGVPADVAGQPFLDEGPILIPLKNLTPESAERVKKVFENADVLVDGARRKVALLREAPRIATVVDSLDRPLKQKSKK
jgi:hypothetical protein